MMKYQTTNRILWLLTLALALTAAAIGLFIPSSYKAVASPDIIPGIYSQDLMTAVVCLVGLGLVLARRETPLKARLILSGIMLYLFYGYGIYVIEQLYNALYPLYMAVFGLSLYTLIVNASSLPTHHEQAALPRWLCWASAVYLLLNAFMFYALWGSQLAGHIQAAERIEYTFSIYILDLCLIMPAFVIVAIQLLRKKTFGTLATPSLLVFGALLLLPLVAGELIKPVRYGISSDTASIILFGTLTLVFTVLSGLTLKQLDL